MESKTRYSCIQLLLFNLMLLRSIHVAAYISSMREYSFLLSCDTPFGMAFHVAISQIIYPLICCWAYRLFAVWGYLNEVAMCKLLSVNLCMDNGFIFLEYIPRVKWLGPMLDIGFTFQNKN